MINSFKKLSLNTALVFYKNCPTVFKYKKLIEKSLSMETKAKQSSIALLNT